MNGDMRGASGRLWMHGGREVGIDPSLLNHLGYFGLVAFGSGNSLNRRDQPDDPTLIQHVLNAGPGKLLADEIGGIPHIGMFADCRS